MAQEPSITVAVKLSVEMANAIDARAAALEASTGNPHTKSDILRMAIAQYLGLVPRQADEQPQAHHLTPPCRFVGEGGGADACVEANAVRGVQAGRLPVRLLRRHAGRLRSTRRPRRRSVERRDQQSDEPRDVVPVVQRWEVERPAREEEVRQH